MSENQEFVMQETSEAAPAKKSIKWWLVGGCGLITLLLIAAVALFVFFDPFGLVAMLLGGGEIAAIVPDDVTAYVEIDLLAFQDEDLQEIIEAFEDAAPEVEEEEPEDYQDTLEDNLGVTMEDIIPWVGQYVGIAITDLDFDDLENEQAPPMVVIFESRDRDEADAFVADVIDHREDEFDEEFEAFEFDRVTFYDNDEKEEHLILGRYRNYVFVATDEDILEDVLDLVKAGRRAEDTLAESEMYQRTLEEMPEGALATAYLNGEEIRSFYEDAFEDLSDTGIVYEPADYEGSAGMAISVVEAGIQMDIITIYTDPDDLPWADLETEVSDYSLDTAGMIPEETFVYISGYVPEGYSEVLTNMMGEDYLESMEMIGDELDVDINELYQSVEGEVAIAVFEQESGFLSEIGGMPIGASIVIGVSDESEWLDLFGELTSAAGLDSMTIIEDLDLDGFDLQTISMDDGYSTYPFMLYGSGNDFVVLSTEVENAEILIGEGDTLADLDDFQDIWEAFPEDSRPILYLDVIKLVDFVEEVNSYDYYYDEEPEDEAAVLEPLTAVAAANTFYTYTDHQTITVIFFIDR